MRTLLPPAVYLGVGLTLGVAFPRWAADRYVALGCLGLASGAALAAWMTGATGDGAQPAAAWLRRCLVPALLAVSLLAGVVLAPRPPRAALPLPGMSRLSAQVEEVQYGRDGQVRSRVRVLSGTRLSDGAALPSDTHLIVEPFPLPENARISLLASVKPRIPFRNQTPHPALRAAHPTQGVARMPASNAAQLLSQAWPARALDELRTHVRRRLDQGLPEDAAAVARAILLGDPDVLDDAQADDVRGAGLSHVFAVSGMHVTLLAGLLVWLLTRALLRVRSLAEGYDVPRLAAALGVPLALAIAPLTGGAPSGWRASLTTALAWLVTACGRRPDATAVTAAACLAYAVAAPADALRPAFLLSIAATSALLQHSQRTSEGFMGSVRALLGLTLRTSLATAPIVWWSFGSLPLVGLLANLLLVPVGSLLLVVAALHALVACTISVLAPLTAGGLSVLARAFLRGCSACNALDPHLVLPVLSLPQGFAVALGTLALLHARRRRTRVCAVALTAAAYLASEAWLRAEQQPRDRLRVTFLDVGQGDSALVDLPNGQLMLIDAGGNPQGGADPGRRVLLPLLAARRRTSIDVAVLTHPHPDHYGGLAALFTALPVAQLWDNGQAELEAQLSATSRAADELVRTARARGALVRRPGELCGVPQRFGAAEVRVLSPCPAFDSGFDPNDNSLVLRIDYAGRGVLFTGDIEAHAESQLLGSGADLRADVLKVPHHGSRTSSSEALLRAIQPDVAIVSAGAVNPFGHPHPEVMARLSRLVPRVIDLGEHGGTQVTIDRYGTLSVESTLP